MNEASPIKLDRNRAFRARKKAAGLREVRLWVPDMRLPGWQAEAKRQSALLDHSEDEREASDMMVRLAQEVWDREP